MKLKKQVTKKIMLEAQKIVDTFGYWSQEFSAFVEGFEYEAKQKIHNGVRR